MSNDTISELLVIVLGVMIFILMLLSIIFIVLKAKENKKEKEFDKKITGKSPSYFKAGLDKHFSE